MTFEIRRIQQRLADLEKNQDRLLKIIGEINKTLELTQKQIFILQDTIYKKNTGKDHP
jgi:hypothetical protein